MFLQNGLLVPFRSDPWSFYFYQMLGSKGNKALLATKRFHSTTNNGQILSKYIKGETYNVLAKRLRMYELWTTSVSANKCVSINVSICCYNIGRRELDVAKKTEYLGVQVDNSLDWKAESIKAESSKVSRAIGFLKHARNILPMASLKTLYSGIVKPHFRYCCSVWGCCGTTDINQLQKLQNRAASIVTDSSYDSPSGPLIGSLGWKTIRELVNEESRSVVSQWACSTLHAQSFH